MKSLFLKTSSMETTKVEISKDGDSIVITIDWHAETLFHPNWYCHEITQEWDFTKVVIHNNKPWKQTNKTHSLSQYTDRGNDIDGSTVT